MTASRPAGLMASLRRLAATAVGIVQVRLQLLSIELEEEALRLARMVFLAGVTVFCFAVALVLLSALVVVAFWDHNPLAALGGLSLLYLVLGLVALTALRGVLRARPRLFAVSLAELAKDREYLNRRHDAS